MLLHAQTVELAYPITLRAFVGNEPYLLRFARGERISGTIEARESDDLVEEFDITEASGRLLFCVPYDAVRFVEL